MEHELFQSKLKPSVDGALISSIIRGSSSGGSSYRAAAMELIFERSIQERRNRTPAKMKKRLRQKPTPQLEKSSEEPNISIPQVQSASPSPAPQPQSQSSTMAAINPSSGFPSASGKPEASLGSPTLSKSAKDVDVKTNPPPPEDTVQLVCIQCNAKRPRSYFQSKVCCDCFGYMKCAHCGSIRLRSTETCAGCYRKFK